MGGDIHFNVSNKFETLLTIGVVKRSAIQFDLYQIPASTISKFGNRRGGHTSLNVKNSDGILIAQGDELPKIEDFTTLRLIPLAA